MDIITSLDPACFRPPASSVGINHSAEYIKSGSGKDSIRRIFHNVRFDEFESQAIEECEAYLVEQETRLPQEWTQSETLKYLYATKFDAKSSAQLIQAYLDWHQNPQSLTLTAGAQMCLESGAVYMWGFDNQCRPVLIVDLTKLAAIEATAEDFQGALAVSMEILKTCFFVPGKVENWVIILDAQNIPTLENAKIDTLTLVLNCYFPSTLEKLIIISSPESEEAHYNFFQGIDKEMAQQVEVVASNDLFRLQNYIPPTSLEKKYGGVAPTLEAFWPPQGRAASRRGSELNRSLNRSLTAVEAQQIAEQIQTDQRHTTAGLVNHYNVDNSVDYKERSTLADRLLASGGVGSKKIGRGEFQKYTPEKATGGLENEEQFIRSFLFTKSPTKSAMGQVGMRQDQIRNAQFAGNALQDDQRSEKSYAKDTLRHIEETTDGGSNRIGTKRLQVNTDVDAAKKGEISTGDKTPKEWMKDQLNNSATKEANEDKGVFCGFCFKRSSKPAKATA